MTEAVVSQRDLMAVLARLEAHETLIKLQWASHLAGFEDAGCEGIVRRIEDASRASAVPPHHPHFTELRRALDEERTKILTEFFIDVRKMRKEMRASMPNNPSRN